MILKPGNLLCMARLGFRVKCNNQFKGNPQPLSVVCFRGRHFLWNAPVQMNYT